MRKNTGFQVLEGAGWGGGAGNRREHLAHEALLQLRCSASCLHWGWWCLGDWIHCFFTPGLTAVYSEVYSGAESLLRDLLRGLLPGVNLFHSGC